MVILALFFTEPIWCCAEPDVVLDGLLSMLNQGKRAEVESHQASFAVFSALHCRAILGKAAMLTLKRPPEEVLFCQWERLQALTLDRAVDGAANSDRNQT